MAGEVVKEFGGEQTKMKSDRDGVCVGGLWWLHMLLCQALPVQVAQMIDEEDGDDPLLSEVYWDDVLPWPQQPKLRHHGRDRLLFLELCEKWESESYLLHCDACKQKKNDE